MDVVQPGIGHEAVAARPNLAAEVHVLTGLERGVEAADGFEHRAADGQVAAAEPLDRFLATGMAAEPIVQALHPRRRRWRTVRRPDVCRRSSAAAMISFTSLIPAVTALTGTNSAPVAAASSRPMVVLPVPGGPQKISECSVC